MALINNDSDINRIIAAVTRVLERREKERLGPLVARETERVGMGAPAVERIRAEERGTTEEKLAVIMSELLEGRRVEKRQERLIGEERIFTVKRTRAQWAELAQRAQKEMAFRRESATVLFGRQQQVRGEQRTWEEKMGKEARKRASESVWKKIAWSLGIGAVTGGVGAVTGLLGAGYEGWKGLGKGAGIGALVGPGGVGEMVTMKEMFPYYKQLFAKKED